MVKDISGEDPQNNDEITNQEHTPAEIVSEENHEIEHGIFEKKELDHEYEKEKKKHKKNKQKKSDVDEKDNDREQVIADQLAEIYENSDGSMPDMKTFESRKTSSFIRALIIFLISCFFFGAAAWVGLFMLQPKSQFSETDVTLTISGEESVAPGGEVTYRVRYRNAQSVGLNDAVLELRYPQGFKVTTTTKPGTTDAADTWNLGNLDPGSGGYIDVTGKFFGDSGSEQSIRAFLSYKPANFTSTFQAVATKKIQAKTDSASIDIELAGEVPHGTKTPITITITPSAGITLEHTKVICTSPEFTLASGSTPEADKESPCSWSFAKLGDKTVIQLSGMFTSAEAASEFGVELRGWDSEEYTGEGFILAQSSKSITLVESTTNISLVINGGSGDTTISPGETMSASIVVQNKGDVPLTNVTINAVIDGPSYNNRSILGWQDLKLTGDGDVGGEQLAPDTRRGTITWDKRFVPELASIPPGGQVQVDVSIPIRTGDQITLANFTTNNIIFSSNFSYGKTGERKTVASNQINLALVSDFALNMDHDFIPTTGVAGTYDVSWTISNSFHPLKNIKLEADLYGDVTVDQSKITVGGGSANYVIKDKRIIWTIPEMPTSVDVLNLQFAVVLKTDNPTQKDLMSKVRMSADDDTSHVTITKVGEGIGLR